jgi:S-adenosylmethionine:tRNA ribosyltransferase-isomerase
MNVADFDYDLPESYIAQKPADPRDSARLLYLNRPTGEVQHYIFHEIINLIHPGDVLVMNTTRVIPARLRGFKMPTGGAVEVLLLRQIDLTRWRALVGGKRVTVGTSLGFSRSDITAVIEEDLQGSERVINFSQPVNTLLEVLGETPLPPYIHAKLNDAERYQTVYSREEGSAAAPTAGLHFTSDLLSKLRHNGVLLAYCTLHIGLDTFLPLRVENVEEHHIHSEFAMLDANNALIINEAKLAGGRVVAVGTTTARTLETAALLSAGENRAAPSGDIQNNNPSCPVTAFARDTNLFIYPGYRWRVVDALITNFHLPKSTLLMMISAFAGRENVLHAYEIAKKEKYRFFSFGDAMFIE